MANVAGTGKQPTFRHLTIRGAKMVTIEVGPEKHPFIAHKDLLCYHSPYFRAAFEGSFMEAQQGKITLDEVLPETFGCFLDWLYMGKIPYVPGNEVDYSTSSDAGATSDSDDNTPWKALYTFADRYNTPKLRTVIMDKVLAYVRIWNWVRDGPDELLDLYIFGDRFVIPELKRAIIDKWIFVYDHAPEYELIIRAYAELPESSGLRKLLVNLNIKHFEQRYEGELRKELPRLFLEDMYIGYATTRRGINIDPCDYHEHSDEADRKDASRNGKRWGERKRWMFIQE
ncbi:hypothetical protein NA57DRAFT_74430 [Rhizodiscina lignyota]|uniref:BTB domain-containing protein n=1 Tax=Rhizodiscina lignyota TaxID=1504668 RepID=A0A9P4IMH0_9PEZI|nr:hypothetical protein NA57DRAFT_74430 [Rhizodiscina lignyota]